MVNDFPELVPKFTIMQLSFWLLSISSPVCSQEIIKERKGLSKTETRIVHQIVLSQSWMPLDILLTGKLHVLKRKLICYIRD